MIFLFRRGGGEALGTKEDATSSVLKYSFRDEIVFFYIHRDHQFQWYPSTFQLYCLMKYFYHFYQNQYFVECLLVKRECISKNYSLFDHQYIAKKETSDSEKLLHNFIINFIVSSVFTHYISNEGKHRYTRFIFLKEGPGTSALSCEVHIFVEGRIRMKLYFEELPFLRKCGPMFCSLLCMQFSSF